MKNPVLNKTILPALATLVGIGISVVAWVVVKSLIVSQEAERFEFAAKQRIAEVGRAVSDQMLFLRAGGALFDASDEVTRGEWDAFAGALRQDASRSRPQIFGFAEMVPGSDLAEHLVKVGDEGIAGYAVWPEGDRSSYAPIVYVYPFAEKERKVLGFDGLTDPLRRVPMERARDSGGPTFSERVVDIAKQDEEGATGIQIYFPVYHQGMPTATVEQRRTAIHGYIFSFFLLEDLIEQVFPAGLPYVHLQIFSGREAKSGSLLYDSLSPGGNVPDSQYGMVMERVEEFSGNPWTIRVFPTAAFETAAERFLPWMLLGGGILLSFVLGLAIWSEQRVRSWAASLHAAEAHLSATLQSIGDGVISTDASGCIISLNAIAEELTGWKSVEARGRPIGEVFNIVSEMAREPAVVPVADVLASGEIRELANHTLLLSRDGKEYSISDSAAPIRDAKGMITGVVLAFRDVTKQRQAEQKLKWKADELDKFFSVSLDLLAITDKEGRFLRLNQEWENLLGYTLDELKAGRFFDFIHPDDMEITQDAVARLMDNKTVMDFSNRYRCRDGSYRWIEWRSARRVIKFMQQPVMLRRKKN